MRERFQEEHPGFDFSGAEFNGQVALSPCLSPSLPLLALLALFVLLPPSLALLACLSLYLRFSSHFASVVSLRFFSPFPSFFLFVFSHCTLQFLVSVLFCSLLPDQHTLTHPSLIYSIFLAPPCRLPHPPPLYLPSFASLPRLLLVLA